jgi:type 1 fimbriae regulatory protein FimB/type 1 fimbriae regulatory protein FimE
LPGAVATAHPLRGDEVRALRELRREFPDSAFAFATERSGPFTADAINRTSSASAGEPDCPLSTPTCSAMPAATRWPMPGTRRIQDWLGHRSIQHATRYTQLSAVPSKDFSR